MFSGTQGGRKTSSGGSSGRWSQLHQPKRASQIRVNTRAEAIPPWARIQAEARAMCGASGGSPASRRATYASMVAESSGGPPWKVAQVPSACCSPRMNRAAACVVASSRMPRNWRSSRSSASMVTLVSRSPFHQPAGSWRSSSSWTALAAASWTSARRPAAGPGPAGGPSAAVACAGARPSRPPRPRVPDPRRRPSPRRRRSSLSWLPLRTVSSAVLGSAVGRCAPTRGGAGRRLALHIRCRVAVTSCARRRSRRGRRAGPAPAAACSHRPGRGSPPRAGGAPRRRSTGGPRLPR